MSAVASQISSVSIVCSTVGSGADQRKHQSSASLTFVRGIQRWPVTKTSNEENVSIWWCHHDYCAVRCYSSSPVLTQILLLSHVIGWEVISLTGPPPLPRLSPLPVVCALKCKFLATKSFMSNFLIENKILKIWIPQYMKISLRKYTFCKPTSFGKMYIQRRTFCVKYPTTFWRLFNLNLWFISFL